MNREELAEIVLQSLRESMGGGSVFSLSLASKETCAVLWPVLAQVWDEGFSEAERHVERDTPIRNPYSEVPA